MVFIRIFDRFSIFVRMYDSKELLEKDRILDAAIACFRRFGPDKTTLGDIAQNLGYSRTKIYYYFRDKESVSRAVLLKMSKAYFEEQEAIVLNFPDTAVCLEKLLRNRVRYIADVLVKGIFSLELAQEMMETDEELRQALEQEHQLYLKIVRKGIKEELFRVKNVALHTQIILDSVAGYFHVVSSRYRGQDLQRHLNDIEALTNAQIKFIIQSIYKK